MEHLSDIELYYSPPDNFERGIVTITGEEYHHAIDVMRNKKNDLIHITDGEGNFYKCSVTQIVKSKLTAEVQSKDFTENKNRNLVFCVPYLKNPERMKFAIEKSVELGITSFILFPAKRSVVKSTNLNRIRKIALSAMKQSLRYYLPNIIESTLKEISNTAKTRILLEQKSETNFDFVNNNKKYYCFLFGPEGGFDSSEMEIIKPEAVFCLAENRLRTETAIIKCASLISKL